MLVFPDNLDATIADSLRTITLGGEASAPSILEIRKYLQDDRLYYLDDSKAPDNDPWLLEMAIYDSEWTSPGERVFEVGATHPDPTVQLGLIQFLVDQNAGNCAGCPGNIAKGDIAPEVRTAALDAERYLTDKVERSLWVSYKTSANDLTEDLVTEVLTDMRYSRTARRRVLDAIWPYSDLAVVSDALAEEILRGRLEIFEKYGSVLIEMIRSPFVDSAELQLHIHALVHKFDPMAPRLIEVEIESLQNWWWQNATWNMAGSLLKQTKSGPRCPNALAILERCLNDQSYYRLGKFYIRDEVHSAQSPQKAS